MDEFLGIVGLFAYAIMAGAICGIVAIAQLSNLKQEITQLKAKFSTVEKCTVKIKKINPPIDGDVNYVSVIVEE